MPDLGRVHALAGCINHPPPVEFPPATSESLAIFRIACHASRVIHSPLHRTNVADPRLSAHVFSNDIGKPATHSRQPRNRACKGSFPFQSQQANNLPPRGSPCCALHPHVHSLSAYVQKRLPVCNVPISSPHKPGVCRPKIQTMARLSQQ